MRKRGRFWYITAYLLAVSLSLSACGDGGAKPAEPDSGEQVQAGPAQTLETCPPQTSGSAGGIDAAAAHEAGTVKEQEEPSLHPFDITLTFAGDICLSEDGPVMANYMAKGGELTAVIDPKLIEEMNAADIMWINNEFTYSDRGEPLPGKVYTFRAAPEQVNILHELGVDVAGLANNHVYDYGEDAFYDTLDTLKNAEIAYVGAGRDLKEAGAPLYLTVDDKVIAFVAASRAEKNIMTPQASENTPGILRCYDTELFLQAIGEAAAHSDYCIALVHWGTEYSTALEEVQLSTGREYLDAGADAVIGGHSHCLQGFEFYNGKPIIYSLGNFWFSGRTLDSMLVTLHIYGDDTESRLDVSITPALQAGCATRAVEGEEARALFDRLEEISIDVRIGDDGSVQPAAQSGDS